MAILLAAALFLGCASSGRAGSEILTGSINSSAARQMIYRASVVGFAVQPHYLLDGKPVAGSQPNGLVVCDLPPGRHEVAVANLAFSNNLFGRGSELMTLDLRSGTMTCLAAEPQVGIMTPGRVTLMQVAENQGRADTAKLHQISAACGKA